MWVSYEIYIILLRDVSGKNSSFRSLTTFADWDKTQGYDFTSSDSDGQSSQNRNQNHAKENNEDDDGESILCLMRNPIS